MNNDLVPSLIDLYLIITHLTSKNPSQIEESIRAISLYLSHNRKDAEEVISRLSQFINSNIKSLTIPIIVKLITSILKTLADTNNVQISHIAKNLFPLLINFLLNMFLAFYSSGNNAFNNIFLTSCIKNNDWNDCKYNHCHHGTHINRTIATLQILNCNRDGLILFNIKY